MIYTSAVDSLSNLNSSSLETTASDVDRMKEDDEFVTTNNEILRQTMQQHLNKLLVIYKDYRVAFKELLFVVVNLPQDSCIKPLIALNAFNQFV